MPNQNITLSLPAEELRVARIAAARQGVSVSRLLSGMLRELAGQDAGYARAKERSLATLSRGADLGTDGRARVSRDELHER